MLKNNTTNEEETLNDGEEKKTIRLSVEEQFARELLDKINAPTPDASEIDEIVLVIKK